MHYIGIDIGSTAAKVYVQGEETAWRFSLPTGWSSRETARLIEQRLGGEGIDVADKTHGDHRGGNTEGRGLGAGVFSLSGAGRTSRPR